MQMEVSVIDICFNLSPNVSPKGLPSVHFGQKNLHWWELNEAYGTQIDTLRLVLGPKNFCERMK